MDVAVTPLLTFLVGIVFLAVAIFGERIMQFLTSRDPEFGKRPRDLERAADGAMGARLLAALAAVLCLAFAVADAYEALS
jgi:hypothetical protein